MTTERIWHKGPPPHVGWWNASRRRDEDVWRWWDGRRWSIPVHQSSTSPSPTFIKPSHSLGRNPVQWSDYWPENARVPRLDPTGGHWTFNTDGEMPKVKGDVWVAFRYGHFVKAPADQWCWWVVGTQWDILAWRKVK